MKTLSLAMIKKLEEEGVFCGKATEAFQELFGKRTKKVSISKDTVRKALEKNPNDVMTFHDCIVSMETSSTLGANVESLKQEILENIRYRFNTFMTILESRMDEESVLPFFCLDHLIKKDLSKLNNQILGEINYGKADCVDLYVDALQIVDLKWIINLGRDE